MSRLIFISYSVEQASTISELENECEKSMAMGWECIGGICVVYNPIMARMQYFQSMGLRQLSK